MFLIKGNKVKPYNTQFIKENRAKTKYDITPLNSGRRTNNTPPKQAPSYNVVPRQN
jgi:hypothetical protein